MFHSCLHSQSPSLLALSCFTCIILHLSRVCDCMYLHVLELCMYMHVLKACMCMHVSQAFHVFACVCSYQKLIRYLHLFAPIERSVCICIHWLILRAERLSACGSRAEHLLACFKS